MGTWGHNAFENDHAKDFVAKVKGSPRLETLRDALLALGTAADEARAIAAAEIVANGKRPTPASSADAIPWARSLVIDESLSVLARTAVEAIRSGSKTRALWAESGELDEWLSSIDDLLQRLGHTLVPTEPTP